MELNLQRPLLFFDIESTGLNIATDGIIELSFVKVFPDGEKKIKTWKIKPWDYETMSQIPINPQASEVNGVKDEDLVDCPRFIEVVGEVVEWLRDSDLAGYNSGKFDLPMLAEEMERVKLYCTRRISDHKTPEDKREKARQMLETLSIDLHEARMVDVQNIYHYMEPRNLRAAYRFYCGGEDFENAHTAEADTLATYEVLKGELEMYQEPDKYHDVALKNDVEFLAGFGQRSKGVDYACRIILRDNVPTVSFGKYKDMSVREVFNRDRSYFDWIEKGDFTLDTKAQFRKLYRQYEAEDRQAKSKPLSAAEITDAADLLRKHFGGQ
ncbi:MAG: 3'-5' exonuclease [Bacteroidales bacterium]|nr:3'-5' exonuclease [Bacteroidales bacterium]